MDIRIDSNVTRLSHPLHPYYPIEANIVGYLANELSVPTLLSAFSAGCSAIFTITYVLVKRVQPHIKSSDLVTIMWFILSGCIHFFFEGYYVYNFRRMGGMQDLFGQLWKEYAFSDSRYLTENAFVLCMETITAVCWGPLSIAVAMMIATNHPLRYSLQAIVSLGQLYGDVLYYATSLFDHYITNVSYSRPEAYYYWGYFVFMNVFWIVIPFVLILNSARESARAFRSLQKVDLAMNANGAVKKRL